MVRERNSQGIRCTLDVLGEHADTEEAAHNIVEGYNECARSIGNMNLKASLAIKPSALGAVFDRKLCTGNILEVINSAHECGVQCEIDMEGTPLVDYTLDIAGRCSREGFPIILALQAYLKRTPDDVSRVIEQGITVRLVKGAYKGDTGDFSDIQTMFLKNCDILLEDKVSFLIGTHDPEIIQWIEKRLKKRMEIVEFGFLRGLGNRTKMRLADDGWHVSEYIPFGDRRKAYETRRKRYLRVLETLGRSPAP
jgi:proline dehydrogenase